MVKITDQTLCISISTPLPGETLSDLQRGIITALKEQYRNEGNREAVSFNADTLSGNFALLNFLECLIESASPEPEKG